MVTGGVAVLNMKKTLFIDDECVFNNDGTFQNILGETWLEGGKVRLVDGCGAPIAPHDGAEIANWEGTFIMMRSEWVLLV